MLSKIETEASKNAFALDEAARLLDRVATIEPEVKTCIYLLCNRLRNTQKMLDDYRDLDAMLCK